MESKADSLRTYLNNVLQHPGPFTDPDYDASQVADNMANMKLLSVAVIPRN
jgi:ubiquitin-activating enzyme E1 C